MGLVKRKYESDGVLGLQSGGLTDWERFERFANWTNDHAGPNVHHKILFMGRHGEGEHNVAEAKYGTDKWNVGCVKLRRYVIMLRSDRSTIQNWTTTQTRT